MGNFCINCRESKNPAGAYAPAGLEGWRESVSRLKGRKEPVSFVMERQLDTFHRKELGA